MGLNALHRVRLTTQTLIRFVNNVLLLVKLALELHQHVLRVMEVKYCTSQHAFQNVLNHLILKTTSVLIVIPHVKHVQDLQLNVLFVLRICISMSKNVSFVQMDTKEMMILENVRKKNP